MLDPMDCSYLGENRRLRSTLASTKRRAAADKTAVSRLQSKIKAERILNHTAKNAMAEAQGAIELCLEQHRGGGGGDWRRPNGVGGGGGGAGATALALALRHCEQLSTLDLKGNGIGDAGATALATAPSTMTAATTQPHVH